MRWSEMNSSQKQTMIRLAVLAVLGAGLILAGGQMNGDEKTIPEPNPASNSAVIQNNTVVNSLERQLEQTLSQVKGAGTVKVQIAVSDSGRKEYARDVQRTERNTEEQSDTGQQKTAEVQEQKTVVQQSGQSGALLVAETMPDIRGVLIVADGAGQASVQEQLLNAVATLLELSTEQIMVLPGKGANAYETDET